MRLVICRGSLLALHTKRWLHTTHWGLVTRYTLMAGHTIVRTATSKLRERMHSVVFVFVKCIHWATHWQLNTEAFQWMTMLLILWSEWMQSTARYAMWVAEGMASYLFTYFFHLFIDWCTSFVLRRFHCVWLAYLPSFPDFTRQYRHFKPCPAWPLWSCYEERSRPCDMSHWIFLMNK